MAGFNLSGAMAGAGQGLTDVGKTMVTTGAALNIEAERAKVQALRDERQMAFTTTERVAGEGFKAKESGLERGMKERQHKENLTKDERNRINDLHKNILGEIRLIDTQLTNNPSDPTLIAERADATTRLQEVRTMAMSKIKPAEAVTPKAGAPTDGKRDWRAFAKPEAKADVAAPPEVVAAQEAKPASVEPETGALNEISATTESPITRAARSVGGIINSARTTGYKPGVSKSEDGTSQDIQPGMNINVGGRKMTVMTYLKDSQNGAVWRVRDEKGKMYEYVAPLK